MIFHNNHAKLLTSTKISIEVKDPTQSSQGIGKGRRGKIYDQLKKLKASSVVGRESDQCVFGAGDRHFDVEVHKTHSPPWNALYASLLLSSNKQK